MGKRIAIIFEEDIYCQRGMFNAIRNRIKHLKDIADYDIDVYVICRFEPWYIRRLRNTTYKRRVHSIELDGIKYNVLWYSFTLVDYILKVKMHRSEISSRLFYLFVARKLRGYTLVSAHSTNCGALAMRISKRDGIPFFVTWHGTDIHTAPFQNKSKYRIVERVLKEATCNFFVSDSLKQIGLTIASDINSEVLYNGRNMLFEKYSYAKKKLLREKYHVPEGAKVVGFAGHLTEVKNPQLLAPIFDLVQKQYKKTVLFWIIGTGKMQCLVEDGCRQRGIGCTFWGNQPADIMPEFMNCMDVLVLPSRNEGLPLVVVEAIACGSNAVGSDVGGISEAIGKENVFQHGEDFIPKIANRIVDMLNNEIVQVLNPVFSWQRTAMIENDYYRKYMIENK